MDQRDQVTATTVISLGIGVTTYNRHRILRETIENVVRFTRHESVRFVVADDGSTDETQSLLRVMNVPYIVGPNMGVAWNKNRALYFLNSRLRCDVTILLEDDTQPTEAHWEQEWIAAAIKHGHANSALDSDRAHFRSGSGSADDPVLSDKVTAQCSVFSAKALERSGYFDSRFRGYGHEHVEHSARLVRHGFGGFFDEKGWATWKLIKSPLRLIDNVSTASAADVSRNAQTAHELMMDHTYRAPWRNDDEMTQFLGEMDAAVAPPGGYELRVSAKSANGPTPTPADAPVLARRRWSGWFFLK